MRTSFANKLRKGQAMLEYVLLMVLGALLVGGVMTYFIVAANQQAERASTLAESERI